MGRTRINQNCPDCDEPVSSTQIICACGGSVQRQTYNSNGRKSNKEKTRGASPVRRRTERTKRGKPNYYDALEFEKAKKKRTVVRAHPHQPHPPLIQKSPSPTPALSQPLASPPSPPLPQRMKLKAATKKEEEIREEDLEPIVLSQEKIAKFALILDEINRKICNVSWRPDS